MGQALHTAADSEVLRSHPLMRFKAGAYSFEVVREAEQSFYRVTDGKETMRERILYAFGDAYIAQTYVFRYNGRLREGRVSYYRAIDGLDWTIGDALNPPPSVEEAAGRDIESDEARNCFSCHGTGAIVNGKLDLDHLSPGVSCEACHGPGEKHAVAKLLDTRSDAPIFNPKSLDPETLSQEFCGACHRGVDIVAMMPDLGGISNVRFQPYRLFNSRGHDPKDAHFACTACHDPHTELKHGDAEYESHCTSCHGPSEAASTQAGGRNAPVTGQHGSSPTAKRCPVAKERCVSCHMPKVELPVAHFRFTDHRIRIVRAGEPYPY